MAELVEKEEGECAFAVKVRVLLAGNARWNASRIQSCALKYVWYGHAM